MQGIVTAATEGKTQGDEETVRGLQVAGCDIQVRQNPELDKAVLKYRVQQQSLVFR